MISLVARRLAVASSLVEAQPKLASLPCAAVHPVGPVGSSPKGCYGQDNECRQEQEEDTRNGDFAHEVCHPFLQLLVFSLLLMLEYH
jgi:hypothetical protein